MSGYKDFSQFYDGLTFNVDYQKRADYFEEICARFSHTAGIVLDLACGTGSLTLELKKRGYDIYGIDGSEDMLSKTMEKAYDEGLSVLFLCQDMREIDLYGTINTCICTLDSINHLIEKNDVQKTFDRVSFFMEKDGLFIFDVNTVYKHQQILADNTFVYDTDDVFCVWQNSLEENNIVRIELNLFENEDDVYYRTTEEFCERAYAIDELKEMLEKAGFIVENVFADGSFDSLEENSDRAVFVARKKEQTNFEA